MHFAFILLLVAAGSVWSSAWVALDSVSLVKQLTTLPRGVQSSLKFQSGKLESLEISGDPIQNGHVLFAFLDSLNGSGGWSEVDPEGHLEESLRKKVKDARQAWFTLTPGQVPLLAVLLKKKNVIRAWPIPHYKPSAKVPLELKYRQSSQTFADFNLYPAGSRCDSPSPCHYIHMENDQLQAIVTGRQIRMGYRHPDTEVLQFPKNYAQMSDQEKADWVEQYRDFFKHEFAVMIRAFIHTTPGLFNWQAWQWPLFSESSFITSQEIHAIFLSGHAPSLYTIMRISCKGGETVRFDTDGNGSFFLEIQ